jgi:pSer/pThr/pTyr-binding forkhead associated (FHA) protein
MRSRMTKDLFDPDPLAASRRRSAAELQARYAIERRQVAYVAYRDGADELRFVELDSERAPEIVIGRAAELDISLRWDLDASNVHAVIKQIGTVWVLDDVGSLNGTFVNDQRLVDNYKLIDRDLIRVGETYLAYRAAIPEGHPAPVEPTATRISTRPPPVTVSGDQKRVLVELCRPLLESDGLPAATPTNSEIAQKLFMARGTVASHLRRISALLAIHDRHGAQRELLAREAIRLQLVSRRDLA